MNYDLFDEKRLLSDKKFRLLKWVGGKKKLLKPIVGLISMCYKDDSTYYEPFLGSGAVAFSCTFNKMVIGDKNTKLIDFYTNVKSNPLELVNSINSICDEFCSSKDKLLFFNNAKAKFNFEKINTLEKSAYFWFLNKTGFNGMYRENKSGEYNIPFSKTVLISRPDIDDFLHISSILNSEKCTLKSGCYSENCIGIKKGDILYLDPPYIPTSSTSAFTSYTNEDFRMEEHLFLKKFIEEKSSCGIKIILSNSNSQKTMDIYGQMNGFKTEEVEVNRLISGQNKGRGKIKELIIHNVF